jgi:chromosome segregation ATPase
VFEGSEGAVKQALSEAGMTMNGISGMYHKAMSQEEKDEAALNKELGEEGNVDTALQMLKSKQEKLEKQEDDNRNNIHQMFTVQKTIQDRQNRRHSELGKMTQSAHKTVDFTEKVAASAAKGEKDISDLKRSLGETASDTNKLDDDLQRISSLQSYH